MPAGLITGFHLEDRHALRYRLRPRNKVSVEHRTRVATWWAWEDAQKWEPAEPGRDGWTPWRTVRADGWSDATFWLQLRATGGGETAVVDVQVRPAPAAAYPLLEIGTGDAAAYAAAAAAAADGAAFENAAHSRRTLRRLGEGMRSAVFDPRLEAFEPSGPLADRVAQLDAMQRRIWLFGGTPPDDGRGVWPPAAPRGPLTLATLYMPADVDLDGEPDPARRTSVADWQVQLDARLQNSAAAAAAANSEGQILAPAEVTRVNQLLAALRPHAAAPGRPAADRPRDLFLWPAAALLNAQRDERDGALLAALHGLARGEAERLRPRLAPPEPFEQTFAELWKTALVDGCGQGDGTRTAWAARAADLKAHHGRRSFERVCDLIRHRLSAVARAGRPALTMAALAPPRPPAGSPAGERAGGVNTDRLVPLAPVAFAAAADAAGGFPLAGGNYFLAGRLTRRAVGVQRNGEEVFVPVQADTSAGGPIDVDLYLARETSIPVSEWTGRVDEDAPAAEAADAADAAGPHVGPAAVPLGVRLEGVRLTPAAVGALTGGGAANSGAVLAGRGRLIRAGAAAATADAVLTPLGLPDLSALPVTLINVARPAGAKPADTLAGLRLRCEIPVPGLLPGNLAAEDSISVDLPFASGVIEVDSTVAAVWEQVSAAVRGRQWEGRFGPVALGLTFADLDRAEGVAGLRLHADADVRIDAGALEPGLALEAKQVPISVAAVWLKGRWTITPGPLAVPPDIVDEWRDQLRRAVGRKIEAAAGRVRAATRGVTEKTVREEGDAAGDAVPGGWAVDAAKAATAAAEAGVSRAVASVQVESFRLGPARRGGPRCDPPRRCRPGFAAAGRRVQCRLGKGNGPPHRGSRRSGKGGPRKTTAGPARHAISVSAGVRHPPGTFGWQALRSRPSSRACGAGRTGGWAAGGSSRPRPHPGRRDGPAVVETRPERRGNSRGAGRPR